MEEEKCELTGLLSWGSQGVLFLVAFLAVLYKRHVEKPKRPFIVWFYDCFKQTLGTIVEHFASLFISVFLENPAFDGCVWFLTNFNYDLTIGLFLHYLFNKLIIVLVKKLKKENAWWFLESGKYGTPPSFGVFCLQTIIWFVIVTVSKVLLTFLLLLLETPSLIISHWCLSFIRAHRHVEIIIVMGIYPLIMSTLSFIIQDSIIKSSASGSGGAALSRLASNVESGLGKEDVEEKSKGKCKKKRKGKNWTRLENNDNVGNDESEHTNGKEGDGMDKTSPFFEEEENKVIGSSLLDDEEEEGSVGVVKESDGVVYGSVSSDVKGKGYLLFEGGNV